MAEPTLAELIRQKYPGVYDQLDDATLEARVLAKYPGTYDHLPRTKPKDTVPTVAPWTKEYPMTAATIQSGLNALPGIGGIVGGALSTPETLGAGTALGVGLGVGGGRAVRDLLAQALGLEPVDTPVEKGARVALDAGGAALFHATLPGLVEAVRQPGQTVGGLVELFPWLRRYVLPGLDRAPARILERPAWQTWESSINPRDISVPARPSQLTPEELAQRVLNPTGTVTPRPAGPPPPINSPAASPAPAPATPKPAAPAMSPQRIQNELGIAARRAKVTLTEQQYAEATDLVKAGHPPAAAVQRVGGTPTQVKLAPEPPKLKVSAAEVQAYQQLRAAGKTHDEAVALIELQRKLMQSLGTPSSETVRQAVGKRNLAGDWEY